MPFQILNGKGGAWLAEVTPAGELVTRSITEAELEHASDQGKAFAWDSLEINIDATDTMLFVRNDSDEHLHLNYATVNGSDAICTWTIHIGSDTTTPAGGSEVTGVNMNERFSTVAPDTTARSDETAVADGSIIGRVKTPIDNTITLILVGVILGKGHYIQFTQVTESGRGSIILVGHYE